MVEKVKRIIQEILFASRWLQAPIYLALSLLLLAFIYKVCKDIVILFIGIETLSTKDLIITALTLCDIALVANLLVTVIISGYENFISEVQLKPKSGQPIWITDLSHGDVKMKIAVSLVAISSIHLLKQFLNIESSNKELDTARLMWHSIIHIVFMVSALLLSIMYRWENKKK